MSPHNNASVADSSRSSSRKCFCGEMSSSWPGRRPARVNSFVRFEAATCGPAGNASVRTETRLASCKNFFEASLKVFFSFRPQPELLDRQSLLDAPNPVEELLYVFASLVRIIL